jgi:glycosyltransferase involved in cell wall biosynthesis
VASPVKRICMVVYSGYPTDPRVRRETEALLDEGWSADVVCLRREGEPRYEVCRGARVFRLWGNRQRGGLARHGLEYARFLLDSAAVVARLHRLCPYDVVQAHNLPDFLVFAAAVPRQLGARAVLDVHDPSPELLAGKLGLRPTHPVVRLAGWLEQRSAAFADHVITVGEPTRRQLVSRGLAPDKVTVVLNSADPRLFHPVGTAGARPAGSGFRLVYHGGLFDRYGLDLAIRAVHRVRGRIPGLHLQLYGEGEAEPRLRQLIDQLGLAGVVEMGGFVPIDQIPARIADAHLGIVPYRLNRFTELLYPTKAFEYLAMGIPVVVSALPSVVELFGDVPDMFVPPGAALAERLHALHADRGRLRRLTQRALRAYEPHGWPLQRRRYVAAIARLAPDGGPAGVPEPEGDRPLVPRAAPDDPDLGDGRRRPEGANPDGRLVEDGGAVGHAWG